MASSIQSMVALEQVDSAMGVLNASTKYVMTYEPKNSPRIRRLWASKKREKECRYYYSYAFYYMITTIYRLCTHEPYNYARGTYYMADVWYMHSTWHEKIKVIWLHVELVGLVSSSSMKSFASWRSMETEWRRRKVDWRHHFKEKMSQEQAHHHRKPWIRAWR